MPQLRRLLVAALVAVASLAPAARANPARPFASGLSGAEAASLGKLLGQMERTWRGSQPYAGAMRSSPETQTSEKLGGQVSGVLREHFALGIYLASMRRFLKERSPRLNSFDASFLPECYRVRGALAQLVDHSSLDRLDAITGAARGLGKAMAQLQEQFLEFHRAYLRAIADVDPGALLSSDVRTSVRVPRAAYALGRPGAPSAEAEAEWEARTDGMIEESLNGL